MMLRQLFFKTLKVLIRNTNDKCDYEAILVEKYQRML